MSKFKIGPVSDAIPLDPTDLRLRAENLYDVVKELREKNAYVPAVNVSSLNGTVSLVNTSLFQQIVIGSATGFSIELPDATTLFTGERFEIANGSSETISIKNNAGTVIVELIAEAIATLYVTTNFTAAGTWQLSLANGSANGIESYVVSSDTTFTTSSSTPVPITGFSVTPITGRYSVFYSAEVTIAANNKVSDCIVHVDGVAVSNTQRKIQGVGSNFESTQQTIGEVTVDGTESVAVYVDVSSGSLSIFQRSLILIRLGS